MADSSEVPSLVATADDAAPGVFRCGSRSLLDPSPTSHASSEQKRLAACDCGSEDWKAWGPYVSERQWGTCREDYGTDGNSWEYLPFQDAHRVAYRWGEDGIAGICDAEQRLCITLAMWNGKDAILKERLFGLSGPQGNHGEDVKEMYYYLDATPTHSYLKMLYKYPQQAFPYDDLLSTNGERSALEAEYELMDTGVFDEDRYFDVTVEYAQGDGVGDIMLRVTAENRGPDDADFHVLPQAFFRNTWSWQKADEEKVSSGKGEKDGTNESANERDCRGHKPWMKRGSVSSESDGNGEGSGAHVDLWHTTLGEFDLFAEGDVQLLLCENETNVAAVTGGEGASLQPFANVVESTGAAAREGESARRLIYHATATSHGGVAGLAKDAFHAYVVRGDSAAAAAEIGTKAGFLTKHRVPAGGCVMVRFRMTPRSHMRCLEDAFGDFDDVFMERVNEANAFYEIQQRDVQDVEHRRIQRQALAGMIWTKQFYHIDMHRFFEGDSNCAKPADRREIRNTDWDHMCNCDIISMPDKWEFPWYATWDLAFHCVPLALVDASFAKGQLLLMTRDWYMHPNGQLPAYEWNFSDVNPPVHAWASLRVFQMDRKQRGGEVGDIYFLEQVFHKLMINFTWWVNRKDVEGRNIFQGGFLGLDNIGAFDRGGELPTGGFINQSDGTSWMAFYSLNLMRIALELALHHNPVYENIAAKFFEHFTFIARAMTRLNSGVGLWDSVDEFYYDVLTTPNGSRVPLRVRSVVGLIPLFAVEILEPDILEKLPRFAKRVQTFLHRRPDLAKLVSCFEVPGVGERRLLSLLRGPRMKSLLKRMLDPKEFLSDFGIRALSRYHLDNPYVLEEDGKRYEVGYEPAEASVRIMGGNSNWRGPIWFPMNYLIIESLQKFHQYYGTEYPIECPTGSGQMSSILDIANMLSDRLIKLFEPSKDGEGRPASRLHKKMATDPHFRDHILFFEHFHGDTGRGVGASHQTGWTGLVAKLIQARGNSDLLKSIDGRATQR
eukprot:TRINITY_DN43066_c0_g1_i1.p1 TRINITY_DN43066_c0_g1~~TRINITY_DN43066_c0_g1_i1.p1  ORF type:complete len:1035 (+),score=174.69 TRINITY_DN43066_c0_g1_i1:89-3106(+)